MNQLGVNNNVAAYMKPSTLPVYAYAIATATSIRIPTPAGAVNVEMNPYKVVVDDGAALLAYVGQAGENIVNWFVNMIGSTSQQSNGTPVNIQAAQILVTLSKTTNISTILR